MVRYRRYVNLQGIEEAENETGGHDYDDDEQEMMTAVSLTNGNHGSDDNANGNGNTNTNGNGNHPNGGQEHWGEEKKSSSSSGSSSSSSSRKDYSNGEGNGEIMMTMEEEEEESRGELGTEITNNDDGEDGDGSETGRDQWDSRLMFIITSIGAAVGLGNIWRFPYNAYEYGGGAFLVPYALVAVFIGFPIFVVEIALGQILQRGALDALRANKHGLAFILFTLGARLLLLEQMHPGAWGLGLGSSFGSFIVTIYYNVLLAWATIFLVVSFQRDLPYAGGLDRADEFFNHDVLNSTESLHEGFGGLVWYIVLALMTSWFFVWVCVMKGPSSTGLASIITLPLPYIILGILLIRGVTLEGAGVGIKFYLIPSIEKLLDINVWVNATSQIFFSLSIAGGIMIAYGSYNKKSEPVISNSAIIASANCGTSLFAGFVVFSIIGYLASQENKEVSEVVQAGKGLAFVVFPAAIARMPASSLFSVLFFLMLLLLGVASAYGMLEAFSTVLYDRFPLLSRNKRVTTASLSVIGFCVGLCMCTRSGQFVLDILDHFLSDHLLIVSGYLECVIIGWIYGIENFSNDVYKATGHPLPRWIQFCVKWVDPIAIMVLYILNIVEDLKKPYEGNPAWALIIGWFTFGIFIVAVVYGFYSPLPAKDAKKPAKHVEMSSVRTDSPKSARRQPDKDSESKLPLMLPVDSKETL